MRRYLQTVCLLLLCSALCSPQEANVFVVVVNKRNPTDHLSLSKLKVIFLRDVSRWPWGAEVVPVDLPDKNPIRQSFVKSVLDSTPEQLQVYWMGQRISRSIDPPVRVASPSEAKAIVAAKPGAVAYIPASAVDDTVRVLQVK